MRLLEALKKLFNPSPLFADTTKQVDASKRGRKARFGNVKIGQGGTLDPLADGVLGEEFLRLSLSFSYTAFIELSALASCSAFAVSHRTYTSTCSRPIGC